MWQINVGKVRYTPQQKRHRESAILKLVQVSELADQLIIALNTRKFTANNSEQVFLNIDGESPGSLAASFEVLLKIYNLQI